MRRLLSVGAAAALTIGLGTAAPSAHAAPSDYTIELLPPVAGAASSKGYVVNDSGDVAGFAFLNGRHADLLWKANNRSAPVLITADGYEPAGISNTGVVVGDIGINNLANSYFFSNGKLTKTAFPEKDNRSFVAISANGTALDAGARVWTSVTARKTLPDPPGDYTWASGISPDARHVVASSYTSGISVPFIWTDGKLSALGKPSGVVGSRPESVNDHKVVVGAGEDPRTRPVIWDSKGRPSFLPEVPKLQYQRPLAINNSGVIVGRGHLNNQEMGSDNGLLWKDGKVHNLDDVVARPAGSKILEATGINASGQIVGTIRLANNTLRAYVATPKVVNVYTTPGTHHVNGRDWKTTCEKYSQTTRCRTEIIATEVKLVNGTYTHVKGWTFNNLTYLPSDRNLWKGNPLGNKGDYTIAGRQWRTDCDSPATGGNGCRSYILATKIKATPKGAGTYTYTQSNEWVFNNIVMFS